MFWDKVSGVYDLFENIYNKSVYQATGESVAKYIKNTDNTIITPSKHRYEPA